MMDRQSDSHVHGGDHGAVWVKQNYNVPNTLQHWSRASHEVLRRQSLERGMNCACLRILEPVVDTGGFVESDVSVLQNVTSHRCDRASVRCMQRHLAHVMRRSHMSRNILHS